MLEWYSAVSPALRLESQRMKAPGWKDAGRIGSTLTCPSNFACCSTIFRVS